MNRGKRKSVAKQALDIALRENVGQRLMIVREALGMTRPEWQKKYGLLSSSLDQWERGRIMPPMNFLIKLCDEYGFTMDYFLRGVTQVSTWPAVAKPAPVRASAVPQEGPLLAREDG